MKKIGILLLLLVLGLSTYLIFWSQFETARIITFATIGTATGVFFALYERVISAKISFLEIKTERDKARSDAKEIEEILASIKSQKDLIDLIVRDANSARIQITQIETIANESRIKAQKIEKILKDAEEKETWRRLKRLSATGHLD